MLGRVQNLEQLYIIGSLSEHKISTDAEAKCQLEIMKARSINKNPPVWERDFGQSLKILFHNIHSLRDKMEDIKADHLFPFADLIILAETWLYDEPDQEDQSLYLKDTTFHFNSRGRGKGISIYSRNNRFDIVEDINNESLQMTLLKSNELHVLGLYRSKPDIVLSSELSRVIPATGPCLVIGDFNICSKKTPNHQVFIILRSLGFNLLLHEATHFEGGHLD